MPVKTIRAVTLAILFLVALALAFLSFALLLLAVVLCIFFALLASLRRPKRRRPSCGVPATRWTPGCVPW